MSKTWAEEIDERHNEIMDAITKAKLEITEQAEELLSKVMARPIVANLLHNIGDRYDDES